MTHDQYYSSSVDDHTLLNSTINTGRDFNKYDPYVEKIRTLFVPSLEPRIYSCLETFVYRENPEAPLESTYLNRCLNVAATWREPIDQFSNKLEDRGFVENMLAQAVKYFIKDGLIDCFLNSIILNNRLSKVAGNLDAMGFEKDFLRYLAVWNYINEKDYWIEHHGRTSMSVSDSSSDSIASYSDLDVQVGSGLDTQRTERCCKKARKRRASDDLSEFVWQRGNESSDNRTTTNTPSLQFLSVNSINPDRSKSNGSRIKPRSIGKTHSCRPSNCPIYRTKNTQQCDWHGKTLKLRVCKICPSSSQSGLSKPARLSKLSLPCKFDDVIAEIVKADTSISKSSSIAARKKLQAGVTSICRCVNVTLGRMSREEVRRCRFRCEILSGCVSFKLVRRESNGCKVCLFTDRIVTEKIDDRCTPRESSIGQRADIPEQKESHEFDFSIVGKARIGLANEDSKIGSSSRIEIKNEEAARSTNALHLPESMVDADHGQNLDKSAVKEFFNGLSENGVDDQTCGCNSSLGVGIGYLDNKAEGNSEISLKKEFEATVDRDNTVEIPGNVASENSIENGVSDQTCGCNSPSIVGLEDSDNKVENDSKTSLKKGFKVSMDLDNTTEIPTNITLEKSSRKFDEGQTCPCNNSDDIEPEILDGKPIKLQDLNRLGSFETTENINPDEKSTIKNCSNHSTDVKVEDQTCLCDTSRPETSNTHRKSDKYEESNCLECLENSAENFPHPNCQNSDDPAVIAGSPQISCEVDEKTVSNLGASQNDQQVLLTPLITGNSCTIMKSPSTIKQEISPHDISCECPADSCACINKQNNENEAEECDSRCSCESCDIPDESTLINRSSDPSRVSPSRNLVVSSKTDSRGSNPVKPVTANRHSDASSEKWRTNCVESRTNSCKSHRLETHQNESIKSKPAFQLHTDTREIGCDSKNPKHPPFQTAKRASPEIKKSKRNTSIEKSPIRLDTERGSSAKSQRINISIELCSESLSSGEEIMVSERKIISTLWKNDRTRSRCVRNDPLMWKSRCHSVDARIDETPAGISRLDKNTENECLRHFRRTNLHSPSRPLESRRHRSVFEPSPRMGNPDVYGISSKSTINPAGNIEQRSIRQYNSRKNAKSNHPNHNEFVKPYDNEIPKKIQISKPNEFPKTIRPSTTNSEKMSSSIRNNLCHAFSASSIDRMKHLIKTKLRRILLERDKATNTPKISLTNKKYRVSVPNGKTKRLPLSKKRCQTIWESRSATDSACTSTTCRSKFIEVARGDETERLRSKPSAQILSTKPKNFEKCCHYQSDDNETCYNLVDSDRSVVSSEITIGRRLVGGSDAPRRNGVDRQLQYSWKQRQKITDNLVNEKIEYRSNFRDVRLSPKNSKCGSTVDLKIPIEESAKFSHLVNSVDYKEEATFDKRHGEIVKCPGKLDWSDNSTSRHIYLYDYDDYESSNDEEDNKFLNHKTSNRNQLKNDNCKKSQKLCQKNCKQINHRPHKRRYNGKFEVSRNVRHQASSSSKMEATSDVRGQAGLGKIDQDLRSKLSQYVSLCKNVKYSLLKLLRPVDIHDFRRTSISCCD